jgi:hypothetical protein
VEPNGGSCGTHLNLENFAMKIGTRGFFHTANTMVTLIFVFGITFSLIQGGHTIHATECQSEKITVEPNDGSCGTHINHAYFWLKIGTRGFFNTGNMMPLSVFEFGASTTTQGCIF